MIDWNKLERIGDTDTYDYPGMKDCPFCGCPPIIIMNDCSAHVECGRCECQAATFNAYTTADLPRALDKAISAWQRRHKSVEGWRD